MLELQHPTVFFTWSRHLHIPLLTAIVSPTPISIFNGARICTRIMQCTTPSIIGKIRKSIIAEAGLGTIPNSTWGFELQAICFGDRKNPKSSWSSSARGFRRLRPRIFSLKTPTIPRGRETHENLMEKSQQRHMFERFDTMFHSLHLITA